MAVALPVSRALTVVYVVLGVSELLVSQVAVLLLSATFPQVLASRASAWPHTSAPTMNNVPPIVVTIASVNVSLLLPTHPACRVLPQVGPEDPTYNGSRFLPAYLGLDTVVPVARLSRAPVPVVHKEV